MDYRIKMRLMWQGRRPQNNVLPTSIITEPIAIYRRVAAIACQHLLVVYRWLFQVVEGQMRRPLRRYADAGMLIVLGAMLE